MENTVFYKKVDHMAGRITSASLERLCAIGVGRSRQGVPGRAILKCKSSQITDEDSFEIGDVLRIDGDAIDCYVCSTRTTASAIASNQAAPGHWTLNDQVRGI
jgi:hypothetical protein